MKGDNMSKALIYTANTAGAEVAIGNTIPVGSIIRRYGRCIDATGSAINLGEPGYYLVDVSASATAAATGDVTISLAQDGVLIPGATATVTVATVNTQVVNLKIVGIVRVMCCNPSSLSVVVGGTTAPTVENMTMSVVKVV
jgi:hypothetical protein